MAGGDVAGKTIAVFGVTFKQNTDDMRDAPSLVIVPMLQERGATVRVYDPQGRQQAEPLLPHVVWCEERARGRGGRRRRRRADRMERVSGGEPVPRSARKCEATCSSTCATSTGPSTRGRRG